MAALVLFTEAEDVRTPQCRAATVAPGESRQRPNTALQLAHALGLMRENTMAKDTESTTPTLDRISGPADLKGLKPKELIALAAELRQELISTVTVTGGHLGASL